MDSAEDGVAMQLIWITPLNPAHTFTVEPVLIA